MQALATPGIIDAQIGSAGSKTKQGNADDHKRKVIPLADGKDPCQQDLKGQGGKTNKEDSTKNHGQSRRGLFLRITGHGYKKNACNLLYAQIFPLFGDQNQILVTKRVAQR